MSSAPVTVRNRCDAKHIGPRHRQIVDAAVTAYGELWGDRLIAVHLLGSVPRGDAVPGHSDIDIVGLIAGELAEDAAAHLDRIAAALGHAHPVVARVDLDVASADDIHPVRRLILSSDSICVFGPDRLTVPRQVIERDVLIGLVTPDPAAMIEDYGEAIASLAAEDADGARYWSHLVGKDLLKCLRGHPLRQGATYEPSVAAIHGQIATCAPELSGLADALYLLYTHPTSSRDRIRATLARVEAEFLPMISAEKR